MAYVAPASEVYLIKNCPLDIGREHTIKFASASAQQTYFQSNVRATHHWGDYVRINPLDNVIRLGLDYASVYQCNYVAFRNAATLYEQKWYYAFIVECNYINEGTTEIVYSLDYMQTYLFDFEMSPCMIEREHTKTDNVGENIVPEGLDIGEYVMNKSHSYTWNGTTVTNTAGYIPAGMTDIVYLMVTSCDPLRTIRVNFSAPQDVDTFGNVGGVYNGVGVFVFINSACLSEYLEKAAAYVDSIAAIFPFPAALIDWRCVDWYISRFPTKLNATEMPMDGIGRLIDTSVYKSVVECDLDTATITYSYPVRYLVDPATYTSVTVRYPTSIPLFKNEQIDGYTPWNNKMYTAPFVYVTLDSKTGQEGVYRPELFTSKINFGFITSPSAEPKIFAFPLNYRGLTKNHEEGVTKSDAYPYCAWNYDNFKVWIAQNMASLALSFSMGAASAILGGTASAVGRTVVSDITRHTTGKIPQFQPARDAKGRYSGGKGSYTYKDYDKTTQESKSTQYIRDAAENVNNVVSGLGKCASVLANVVDHAMVPDAVRGQVNNGSINQANGINDFYVYIKTVRSEYAKKIDDYFSRYGYAVNKFGMPNILDTNGTPRRRWNYVKTVDCKVHGTSTVGFNHDVEENLEAIFDNGVTFWNLANGEMYDYSQTAQNNNKPSA